MHCCMCARVCGHVGGPWFCPEHTRMLGLPTTTYTSSTATAPMCYPVECPRCHVWWVVAPGATHQCESVGRSIREAAD